MLLESLLMGNLLKKSMDQTKDGSEVKEHDIHEEITDENFPNYYYSAVDYTTKAKHRYERRRKDREFQEKCRKEDIAYAEKMRKKELQEVQAQENLKKLAWFMLMLLKNVIFLTGTVLYSVFRLFYLVLNKLQQREDDFEKYLEDSRNAKQKIQEKIKSGGNLYD